MGARPTLTDVAEAAGVSRALVSIVLRGAPGASEQTRARVLDIAQQLGYRTNRPAALLASRRSRHLGVTMFLSNTFQAELVEHIQAAADEAGYRLVVGTVTRQHGERPAVETLLDFRCEAAVLLGTELGDDELEVLAATVPVVVVGRRLTAAPSVDAVRTADDQGMERIVDHLVELGHRRIAHITGGSGPIADDRRVGFERAMARHRLRSHAVVVAGGGREEDGRSAAHVLLHRRRQPTAIAAYNDHSALGVLDELSRAGVRVPDAISVSGYDDSLVSRLAAVDLTTVSQEAELQAQWAVRAAISRLDGPAIGARDSQSGKQSVLPPQLVVRGSTGRCAELDREV